MSKETTKVILILTILVSFFILASAVSAKGLVPCGGPGEPECDLCCFIEMIKRIFDFLLYKLAGPLFFAMVVIGAIILLIGGGSPKLLDTGKKIIISAVIGLVIMLCAWLIVTTVLAVSGYNKADSWYKFSCGCGEVTATHLECQNGACVEVEGTGSDECSTDSDCRHRECKGMVCEMVNQPGTNTCDDNKDCYHLACDENFDCVRTEGEAADKCSPEGSKCPSHLECARYGECILVKEGGPNQDGCTSLGQTCSAWHLDCNPISLICEKVPGGEKDRCEVIGIRCRLYYLKCDEDNMCIKIWDERKDDECEEEGEPCEAKPACNDSEDNDGDKRIDFPDDPGCTSKDDNSEREYDGPQCDNGRDDDGDNKWDYWFEILPSGEYGEYKGDPECTSPDDNDEWNGEEEKTCDNQCREGITGCDAAECHGYTGLNGSQCHFDQDGILFDYCYECVGGPHPVNSCSDYLSKESCNQDICNIDGCSWEGGWFGFGGSCVEKEEKPECDDGEDNDGDGYPDKDDRACHEGNDITKPYHPEYDDEGAAKTTQCCDGQDNDRDGDTDMSDSECTSPDDNDESNGEPCDKCGEGALNICDVSECHALLGTGSNGCHFKNGLIPHYCYECVGGSNPVNSCSDYLSKESCEADICNIDGCSWKGGFLGGGNCVGGEGPVITFTPTSRPWADTDVSVTVTASDTDGISETYYCWTTSDTCTPNKAFPNDSSLTQALEGDWNLCIRTLDGNGIETTDCSGRYQIDKTLPRVKSLIINGNSSDFTTTETSLSIAWKVTDSGGSGLAEVQVKRRTGGGAWTQIHAEAASGLTDSGSWTDNVTCDYTYEYGLHVLDVAGNKGIEVSTITATVNCLDSREFLGWHLSEADIANPLKQKTHASEDLKNLLSCMDSYLSSDVPREISSISGSDIISDDGTLGSCDPSKCSGGNCSNCPDCSPDKCTSGNCGSCTGCYHSCNSCHYGGASCGAKSQNDTGFSYAVDFKEEGYCKQYKAAAEACDSTAWVNFESDHVHISIKNKDCKCNETGSGKPCP